MKIEKSNVNPTPITMTFEIGDAEHPWQGVKVGDTVTIGGSVYAVRGVEEWFYESEKPREVMLTLHLLNGGCNG